MSIDDIQLFLLVFDHERRELRDIEEFGNEDDALAAYRELEAEFRDEVKIEVVLIGSDSIETVQRTHGNYFQSLNLDPASRYLREFEDWAESVPVGRPTDVQRGFGVLRTRFV